jgi:hypothetical protein
MAKTEKCVIAILGAGLLTATAARADASEARAYLTFQNLGPNGKASKQVFIHKAGRITVDAAWTGPTAELTLTLTRPNGTAASHISGTGGSLTLTYAASQQEVDVSRAANYIQWKVEIVHTTTGGPPVGGRLTISYPWEPISVVHNRQFKLGPPGNVPINQYTYSEQFAVLGPGTIRITASWTPSAMVSALLVQNTVGAVVQKNSAGAFQVAHHVSERSLNIPAWNCTFQNLSQQSLVGTLSISFVPDR